VFEKPFFAVFFVICYQNADLERIQAEVDSLKQLLQEKETKVRNHIFMYYSLSACWLLEVFVYHGKVNDFVSLNCAHYDVEWRRSVLKIRFNFVHVVQFKTKKRKKNQVQEKDVLPFTVVAVMQLSSVEDEVRSKEATISDIQEVCPLFHILNWSHNWNETETKQPRNVFAFSANHKPLSAVYAKLLSMMLSIKL